jgi:RNA polymerase sigma-B factor
MRGVLVTDIESLGANDSTVILPADDSPTGIDDDDTALCRLATMPHGLDRERLRAHIICAWLPTTRRAAARYRHSGEPMEDLVQVAIVGLIQAVDRFDPARSTGFRHFAGATIAGELKHHFRNQGWSVRVSRRVQELHQEIRQVEPELTQRLGRVPTVADLAAHLHLTEDEVLAGRGVGSAYTARSLNWRARNDDDAPEFGDLLGHEDRAIALVADRESLRTAIRLLPETLKLVLALRFFDNLTQSQIARTIGVSQMHVSRLITRALAILRQQMLTESPSYRMRTVIR